MGIWRAAIDIGGGKGKDQEMTQTAAIEEWLLTVKRRGTIYAVKGASHTQAKRVHFSMIGAGPKGKKNRALEAGRIELRTLDTDRLKMDVHLRLEHVEGPSWVAWRWALAGTVARISVGRSPASSRATPWASSSSARASTVRTFRLASMRDRIATTMLWSGASTIGKV